MPTIRRNLRESPGHAGGCLGRGRGRRDPRRHPPGRPGRRVDRLSGHRLPPRAELRDQDPARRAVPREPDGRPRMDRRRQAHHARASRSSRPGCRSPTCPSSRTIRPSRRSATFTRSTCSFNMCRASSRPDANAGALARRAARSGRGIVRDRGPRAVRGELRVGRRRADWSALVPAGRRESGFLFRRVLSGNAMDLDR